MKTAWLLKGDLTEEATKRIKKLFSDDGAVFDKVMSWLEKHEKMPRITSDITIELCRQTEINPDYLNDIFAAAFQILQAASSHDLTVDDLYADFTALQCCPNRERLDRILKLSEKYNEFFRIKSTQDSGAPLLESASLSTLLKPVIKKRFSFISDKLEQYRPEVTGMIPMVSFEMNLSNKISYTFQLTAEGFEHFVNDIMALRIELAQMMKAHETNRKSDE
jgi:hypothetical protein